MHYTRTMKTEGGAFALQRNGVGGVISSFPCPMVSSDSHHHHTLQICVFALLISLDFGPAFWCLWTHIHAWSLLDAGLALAIFCLGILEFTSVLARKSKVLCRMLGGWKVQTWTSVEWTEETSCRRSVGVQVPSNPWMQRVLLMIHERDSGSKEM